jgi:hypothetical protein
MAYIHCDHVWTLIAVQIWEPLIKKAAEGAFDGTGPNVRSSDDILIAKVDEVRTVMELDELTRAMAAAVRVPQAGADFVVSSSMMRTLADVALHVFPRFQKALVSVPAVAQLAERLQGGLNSATSTLERSPFSAEGRARLYARLILRELGSPFTMKEMKEDFLLVGADPALLLDGLLSDGNFDLFASMAMFYFFQGWLDQTDAFLRFDSWLKFIQSSGKPGLRRRFAVVGSEVGDEPIGRRAALRYLKSFADLAANSSTRLTAGEFVFDGSQLAVLFEQAIVDHFGDIEHQKAALEIDSRDRTIEANTAALQINCANIAQEFLMTWFPGRDAKSDLVNIVCRTAGSTRPPNSRVEMSGATTAQVASLMRAN